MGLACLPVLTAPVSTPSSTPSTLLTRTLVCLPVTLLVFSSLSVLPSSPSSLPSTSSPSPPPPPPPEDSSLPVSSTSTDSRLDSTLTLLPSKWKDILYI